MRTAGMSSRKTSSRQGKRPRLDQKQPPQDLDPDAHAQGSSRILPKVAITRIQQEDLASGTSRGRIKHACAPCQQQKARCSGHEPQCQRCSDLNLECSYSMGKRAIDRQYDRLYQRLREQNKQALSLLSILHSHSAPNEQQMIQNYLDSWNETEPSSASAEQRINIIDSASRRSESPSASEVGSQGSPDILHEDVEKDERSRATGYLGKSSDVEWLRRAKEQSLGSNEEALEPSGSNPQPRRPGAPSNASVLRTSSLHWAPGSNANLSAASYHLDDLEFSSTSTIDAYEMPTPRVSRNLLEYYKSSTNTDFPFLDVDWITECVTSAILEPQRPADLQADSRERSIINVVFAIGASYAHLVGDAQGDERDHLLYYSRARMLGLESGSFVQHPNVQVVQITALTGFYYLCSSQINQAWMVTGYAIRAAYALGLHIRNEDMTLQPATKRARLCLWWALWLLERQLVTLSGRPTGIYDGACSIPHLSDGVDTDSTTITNFHVSNDQYLDLRIDLAKLTQKAIDLLYSPSAVANTWAALQVNMETLEQSLQQWRHHIPAVYDFGSTKNGTKGYPRATYTLGLHFYMTEILITRPCLCGFDQQIKLSKDSLNFTRARAGHCVAAAVHIIDLLPDSFDAASLYESGPWYSQVSFIMQACAIIMLEVSLGASHSSSIQDLTRKIAKLVSWLHEMGKHNAAAYRAWKRCMDLLSNLAPRVGIDLSNIDTTPPELNAQSEGRHHSVYPSKRAIESPCGRAHAEEEYQELSTAEPQLRQQPNFQPWLGLVSSDNPPIDFNMSFEESWRHNDFLAFDPSLLDLLDFSTFPTAGAPAPGSDPDSQNFATGIAGSDQWQQSTAGSGQQDPSIGYLDWEQQPGGGGRQ